MAENADPFQGPRIAGKVKGTLLLARMKYLRSRGAETEERVLRRLSAADQAVVRGTLYPSTWYPADVLLRLEMTIAALLASGDRPRLFQDMGRFSAEANLGPGGVQRPFLKDGDPHFLLSNVPAMYAAQHGDGRRTCERSGERGAVIRSFGGDKADAEDCLTAVGWLQRAIEMSGGREARVVETQCRALGAAHCEYRCSWS
jgi:uncharacterized protein (TIGR02265 family)